MKGKMRVYYDDEADYLEIRIGEPTENYGEDINQDITIFKDEKTGEVVGVGILNFKKKASLNNLEVDLPIDINFVSRMI